MSYITPNDKIYNSWRKMHIRCYDPAYHSYHRYGGRGIQVCPRWHVYANFKEDLQETWFDGATLDRRDNEQHYTPENCEWRTPQANHKPLKYDIAEMYELYMDGMSQSEIARLFGTYQPHVSRLLRRYKNASAV